MATSLTLRELRCSGGVCHPSPAAGKGMQASGCFARPEETPDRSMRNSWIKWMQVIDEQQWIDRSPVMRVVRYECSVLLGQEDTRLLTERRTTIQKGKPHITTHLVCPLLKNRVEVGFDVNVFRAPERRGLDVTTCSQFLSGTGQVTCGKDCVRTPEAFELHEKEIRKHQRKLAKIGPKVIG